MTSTAYITAFNFETDFPILIKLFMHAFIALIVSNIMIYPIAYLLTIPGEEFRRLYCILRNDTGLIILSEW